MNLEQANKKLKKRRPPFNLRYPVLLAIAAICGIWVGAQAEGILAWLFAFAVLAMALVYTLYFKGNKKAFAVFTVIFILFIVYTCGMQAWGVRSYSEEEVQYSGYINSYTDYENQTTWAILRDVTNEETGEIIEGNIALRIVDSSRGLFSYGQKVGFKARLYGSQAQENEHSFDAQKYNLARRVVGTAYAQAQDVAYLGSQQDVMSVFWNAREQMITNLEQELGERDAYLIAAMLLGTDELLESELSHQFKAIGVAHVFSVSGLHVGIIVGALQGLLMLCGMGRKGRFTIISAFLLAYCALTAFSPSIVRASIMTFVLVFAGVCPKRYDTLSAIGVAATVLLTVNPYTLYLLGFQLSFLACLGIITFGNLFRLKNKAADWVVQSLMVTLCAQLACLPALMRSFGYLSIISPLANLIIVPVVSLTLIIALPMSFICLLVPALCPMLSVLGLCTAFIRFLVDAILALGISTIKVGAPSDFVSACYYAVLIMASRFFAVKNKTKIVACVCVAVLGFCCICFPFMQLNSRVELVFLSVGNGDCTIVNAGGECFLIDTGSSNYFSSYNSNKGYRELSSYLSGTGKTRIDAVILTHADIDHTGGLLKLLEEKSVIIEQIIYNSGTIGDNESVLELLEAADVSLTEVVAGDVFAASDVTFTFLFPFGYQQLPDNGSLSFMLNYGQCRAFFCGDNEQEQAELLADLDIACDIMLVPHHGSQNTFSTSLAEAARPNLAIVSSGKQTYQVIEEAYGDILNTFDCGQITVYMYKDGSFVAKEYRNG